MAQIPYKLYPPWICNVPCLSKKGGTCHGTIAMSRFKRKKRDICIRRNKLNGTQQYYKYMNIKNSI